MSLPLQPVAVDLLQHGAARWLHAYWLRKSGGDALPPCAAIVPGEVRTVAPDLMLLEPAGAAGTLRYRQVGAAITARFGIDLTGRILHLDQAGGWADAFHQAIATRRPVALRGRLGGRAGDLPDFEAIALPLAGRVAAGVAILAGMFFFDR